jgi:tripartite-type tricarboxylate transporter receptor subunit TctC
MMSEERVLQLPDIPTARESGYDVVAYFWTGVVAPARMPPTIVAKLNSEVNKVLAKPELRNAILNLGARPKGGTPEALAKLIAAEVPKWADVVKASGTKAN